MESFKTNIGTALVTLAIRPQYWYIIRHNDMKKRQAALSIPTFTSMIV